MEKLSDDFKMAESVYEKQGSGEIEEGGWMKMKRKKKSRRHIHERGWKPFCAGSSSPEIVPPARRLFSRPLDEMGGQEVAATSTIENGRGKENQWKR